MQPSLSILVCFGPPRNDRAGAPAAPVAQRQEKVDTVLHTRRPTARQFLHAAQTLAQGFEDRIRPGQC